jgi:hypothetical protein
MERDRTGIWQNEAKRKEAALDSAERSQTERDCTGIWQNEAKRKEAAPENWQNEAKSPMEAMPVYRSRREA